MNQLSILFVVVATLMHHCFGVDTVYSQHTFQPGESIRNCHGDAVFFQTDGNFVLYRRQGGGAAWDSKTQVATRAVLQSDGNLVVYNGNTPKWNSGVAPGTARGPYRLIIQTDQNLVVYDKNNVAIWDSKTGITALALPCDCKVSSWGSYGSCSRSCGTTGVRTRSRSITQQPSGGGASCPALTSSTACNRVCCPVNCVLSAWGSYGSCSRSCGGGTQSRSRTVTTQASCNGIACGGLTSSRDCNTGGCPVDCRWNPWSSYGSCSKSCAGGTQSRSRTKAVVEQNGGAACSGSSTSSRSCNTSGCPVNCQWNSWGSWSTCTESCGGGQQTRTRSKRVTESNGGTCSGNSVQTQACNEQCCKQDCRLSSYTNWSSCSKSCGGGVRTRSRTVTRQPACNGAACGSLTDSENCNTQACPVDCVLTQWTSFGACSAMCGDGSQTRSRVVMIAAKNGGKSCGELSESRNCNLGVCDCEQTQWSAWAQCSKPCGGGTRSRSRTTTKAGQNCGPLTSEEPCNTAPCNTNCQVSGWEPWSQCSAECAGGTQTATRTVTKQAEGNGDPCPNLTRSRQCNEFTCDCVVSEWGPYGQCDKACGGGKQTSRRTVVSPKIANGMDCPELSRINVCNTATCTGNEKPPEAGDCSTFNSCSGHGKCLPDGTCDCDSGFVFSEKGCDRARLSMGSCKLFNDCSNLGLCQNGQCVCDEGAEPHDTLGCKKKSDGNNNNNNDDKCTPPDCGGNGVCSMSGKCECDQGFELDATSGCVASIPEPATFDCSSVLNCSKGGRCVADDTCECRTGFERHPTKGCVAIRKPTTKVTLSDAPRDVGNGRFQTTNDDVITVLKVMDNMGMPKETLDVSPMGVNVNAGEQLVLDFGVPMVIEKLNLLDFEDGEGATLMFGADLTRKRGMARVMTAQADLATQTAAGHSVYALQADDGAAFRLGSVDVRAPDDQRVQPTPEVQTGDLDVSASAPLRVKPLKQLVVEGTVTVDKEATLDVQADLYAGGTSVVRALNGAQVDGGVVTLNLPYRPATNDRIVLVESSAGVTTQNGFDKVDVVLTADEDTCASASASQDITATSIVAVLNVDETGCAGSKQISEPSSSDVSPSSFDFMIIVYIALAVVVCIAIVLVILIVQKRRSKKQSSSSDVPLSTVQPSSDGTTSLPQVTAATYAAVPRNDDSAQYNALQLADAPPTADVAVGGHAYQPSPSNPHASSAGFQTLSSTPGYPSLPSTIEYGSTGTELIRPSNEYGDLQKNSLESNVASNGARQYGGLVRRPSAGSSSANSYQALNMGTASASSNYSAIDTTKNQYAGVITGESYQAVEQGASYSAIQTGSPYV